MMIRKAITDCFHLLIYEIHKFNGTFELLEIMASIITGFEIPLKEEHVIFFKNIIIPLYKVQTSNLYFDNLIRCSNLFLIKDSSLSFPLLEGILKYWPNTNYIKECNFLQELIYVFEFCDVEEIQPLVNKLFKRIVKCLSGDHNMVVDRALCLFECESFISLIKQYKTISFNMLAPIVNHLASNHWKPELKASFVFLKEMLLKIDPDAYNNALESANQKKLDKNLNVGMPPEERNKLDQKWKNLILIAKKSNPNFVEPVIPFSDNYVICNYNSVYRKIYNIEKYLI